MAVGSNRLKGNPNLGKASEIGIDLVLENVKCRVGLVD